MTLQELFNLVSTNQAWFIYFLIAIPALLLLLWLWVGSSEKAINFKWLYSALAFSAILPGLFAFTLNIYLFLFQRQDIWTFNVVTQLLPIITMAISLWLIKQQIGFEQVPGFEKLGGMLTLIFACMGIMWLVDRTHLVAFVMIPASYLFFGFIALLL